MLRVGLTGGIGSGKSTVAGRLAEHGAVVIDADRLSREVVEPGTDGLAEVAAAFGPGVLAEDGSLDRAALGAVVFADASALARLNAIVHPRVGARTAELMAAAAADAVVLHDVPLLVENRLAPAYHLVLVVHADVEQRVRRLAAGRGMAEADARARIAAQADDELRRAVADVWLDNTGTPDAVLPALDALWADRLVPFEANVRLHRFPSRGGPRLAAPDPGWPAAAARLAARLGSALPGWRVDHIGSTAVPGLAAKDVLDLQIAVPSLADADSVADRLADAGFPLVPGLDRDTPRPQGADPAEWGKRVHASADPGRWANVHLRVAGSPGWRVALLFRDWLRAEPSVLADYEAMKRRTAAAHASAEISAYAEAKEPWFAARYEPMEEWAERTGWSPA